MYLVNIFIKSSRHCMLSMPAGCVCSTQVQRSWMYLENIFIGSEDIRKQLPQESIMFENVHNTFMKLMRTLAGTTWPCLLPALSGM